MSKNWFKATKIDALVDLSAEWPAIAKGTETLKSLQCNTPEMWHCNYLYFEFASGHINSHS